MKFNIPELGTKITLAEDWSFPLHHEYRNSTLLEIIGQPYSWSRQDNVSTLVTLPKGTLLTVDRIYIRKGAKEFSSLTFLMPKRKTDKKTVTRTAVALGGPNHLERTDYQVVMPGRAVRFWVKLADANAMQFEEVPHEN